MARTTDTKTGRAFDYPEPDCEQALELVMQLMAIPGVSGQEKQVAAYIEKKLLKAGVPAAAIQYDKSHHRIPEGGDCGNLILRLPGTFRGPRRMFSAHMDTVPTCIGSKPVKHGNVIQSANPDSGLGADDRAGIAAILTAALEIVRRKLPHPPLTFLFSIQEEIGLHGARLVSKKSLGNPKLAFNWDGGSPDKLTIGATGGYRMTIHVEGVPSHAGVAPQWGVSAIAIAALAIADLHRGGWHGSISKGNRKGTSNIGVIEGGNATNVVTDRVFIRAEARSHDPVFRKRIVREIERAFNRAVKEVKSVDGKTGAIHFDGRLDYESYKLAKDDPSVMAAASVVRSMGEEPLLAVADGGLDANWLNVRGIPTVSLGCGQRNAHMLNEELDIGNFFRACRLALRLATAKRVPG
jgi:tripeptide aminopeptidase